MEAAGTRAEQLARELDDASRLGKDGLEALVTRIDNFLSASE
jgi:hypothetical protein